MEEMKERWNRMEDNLGEIKKELKDIREREKEWGEEKKNRGDRGESKDTGGERERYKVRGDKGGREENGIRGIICGPLNCKTNELISLLESPYGIRLENVYVYSKSL
ncbi:hypothetical protein ALC56_01382 [Trachymyrmex septentrionalis]|uniref:Uncharacterized protein n=1 Tax=Trachymyrmex septentrionalis TaxID=34720 RepID=A0A151K0H4_9HYME|nr:hypothetical protein ALC56_01382 [Trachymyrmex septentrionalis]